MTKTQVTFYFIQQKQCKNAGYLRQRRLPSTVFYKTRITFDFTMVKHRDFV